MAVLIEGISVVVRCSAVIDRYPGGAPAFSAEVPNATLCSDGEIARIGFMTPQDTRAFVERLERAGLEYFRDNRAIDVVVVDQRSGMTVPCDWAEFGSTNWNNDPKCPIAVCRAKPTRVGRVVVPSGWDFARSLSAHHRFVESGKVPESLKFVRSETDVDVYADLQTGQEYFVGRSGAKLPPGE
jgi:hypothetical protein